MGGVSIISGTLTSVSGAFPTFAIWLVVIIIYYYYMLCIFICQIFGKRRLMIPVDVGCGIVVQFGEY